MNLSEIRQKYPQYDHLSDGELAQSLHRKYYPNMDWADFSSRIGLVESAQGEEREKSLLKDGRREEDTVLGAVSSFTHGGSLGLADKVGGVINALGAAPMDALLTDKSFAQAWKDRYNEIARDSEKARKDFAGNHPLAAFGLEVAGNLTGAAPKAIYKAVADKGLKGAKLFASTAGIEGGIQAAADSERLSDVPENAAVGGLASAALAPLLPAAGKSLRWLYDAALPAQRARKRAVQALTEAAGEKNLRNMAYEAQKYGSNVLATGDDKVLQAAQAARQQTPDAASLIENRLAQLADERPAVTRRNIELSFGRGNKYDNIDDLVETTKAKATPLYDALRKIGDLDAYALGKKGSKELGGRLKAQKFSNIEFGRMNPAKLAQLNEIRATNGEPPLTPDMKIPLNVVKKLYDKRIVSDKMKPEEVADMVFDTFYNPNNLVDASKYPHIQAVISPKEKVSNLGFISRDPANGGTVVKSAYLKENDYLKNHYQKMREALEGRGQHQSDLSFNPTQTYSSSVYPSSLGPETGSLRQAPRLSDVQSLNNKNISPLGRYVKDNDLIQNEIKKIRRNPEFSREMRNAADTDFNILDQVNQNLGEMIEDAKRAGHMPTVMRLTMQKNELLKQMDKIAPEYKQARNLYEARGKALRAQAIGEDIFDPKVTPDLMRRKIKDMEWLEQNSLKIGATSELLRKLGQAPNEAVALGRMLNDNSIRKLEAVYGKPAARVFREYAESEVKRNRNMNKVLSGSQTSEKQSLRDKSNLTLNILRNPPGIIGEVLGAAENRIMNETNKAIAELLTDPRGTALLEELSSQKNNLLSPYIADILQRANVAGAVNADR